MAMIPRQKLITACATLAATVLIGCGSAREAPSDPNWLTVQGKAAFGAQCPYGSWIDPTPTDLQALDCNLAVQKAALTQPLDPLILSADCTKKVVTVRSSKPGGLDTTWEVLPDNSFDFNIDGGVLTLADDGRNHPNCVIPTALNIFGSLNCTDRDKLSIDFQANWKAGKLDPNTFLVIPFDQLKPDSGQTFCQVATSCYFSAGAKVAQCP
jgi:hypothetical protein